MKSIVKRALGVLAIGQLLLTAFAFSSAAANEWEITTANRMKQRLQPHSTGVSPGCSGSGIDLCAAVNRFYRFRDYKLAWVGSGGLLPEGAMALEALRQSGPQGLPASDDYSPLLGSLLKKPMTMPVASTPDGNEEQIHLDLVLTDTLLRYAYHRTLGRTDPGMTSYGKRAAAAPCRDLAVELAEMLAGGRLEEFLDQIGPRHAAYRALQKSLRRYQDIKAAGGWPRVEAGPSLQFGDCGPRVAQLRNRLAASEPDPFGSEWTEMCFDTALAGAVEQFQLRHGLGADGVVGAKTLEALNTPVEQRIRQIHLNLERWRWMPEDLGSPHIMVNIPGYRMDIVESGRVVRTMRAIVGQKRRPTPELSGMMTYLEINPYWNVPTKIARKDILPKIQKNPDYLIRQNFRVFDGWGKNARELNPDAIDWSSFSGSYFPFRLRQEPAPHNALGRVKFMFPNDLSVYIHDTPTKNLFNEPSRGFSSGCVRIEEPMALMSFLLERQGWSQERLSEVMASTKRRVVVLDAPVPVYLVYLTAWVDESGEVQFRDDIYGQDQRLLSAMAEDRTSRPACNDFLLHPNTLVQTDTGRHPTFHGRPSAAF
ncbi:MAG: L,D-transpeptidase family protein [Desulfobacterales bacterium]